MLGLALALKKLGHRVTFVVSGYFQDLVTRFGVEFVELGTREQFLASANHSDLWNPRRGFGHIYRSLIEPSLRTQFDALASRYEPGKTVGVTNCFGLGALLAQDKLGLPVVTVHMQPAALWSKFEPPILPGMFGPRWLKNLCYGLGERLFIDTIICPSFNALRTELGLTPVSRITHYWHSPTCVACLFPIWLCPSQPDWPKNLIQTDFPLWDDRQTETLPENVEAFLSDGEPPIVFTPGSANRFGKSFFEVAVEACQALGRRGILLTRFPEQLPAALPREVVHFSFVPLSQLLPRSAAFVNHGGIGSVSQAMAAGIPQLIVPLAHDQFDNASRVKRFGVGDFIELRRFSASKAAGALTSLLTSSATTAGCTEISQRFAKKDGLERMAAAIEQRFS
jgi:rhamnosyltransferase subunit B